ncbi:MAG: cation-translocating P-type ATPase [Christensenellaceae bacterium]|nr:cation-translocating P-type ATPase [Christensenellaceae bacterium]
MNGLSEQEVIKHRKIYGANVLSPQKKRSFLDILFTNFNDPILKILLFATAINLCFIFYTHNVMETFGILISVFIAVLVSTLSEMGSESAFAKLSLLTSEMRSRVRRGGKTIEILSSDIVVGDIVLLNAGDKVPADGVLINGTISVDQSILNGESYETAKTENEKVYSGTVVVAGAGSARINSIGDSTEYGKIARALNAQPPISPLKVKLSKLAKTISLIGYIGAFIAGISYLVVQPTINFQTILSVATLIISVIVMAVPEGLPMMIVVVLSSNMRAMMKDNLLVRKLNAVETAGSLNILFTDKTGTITEGKMRVIATHFVEDERELLAALIINNETENGVGGNLTDRCLFNYVTEKMEGLINQVSQSAKKKITPFSSKTKYMATEMQNGDIYYKGALDVLMPEIKFNSNNRIICVKKNDKLLGLVEIKDPIRKEARQSVRELHSAHIQVVMLTGDSRETAVTIAKEADILQNGIVLTSDELSKMSDAEIKRILPNLRVVARAFPTDKSRLVKLAQELNLVVGMTGDGVNDAPALKLADIGFAMGTGTEVAKSAGDIVITDDDIKSITKAVAFGRTLFESIRKFLVFKLTINFIAMAICIVAPLIGVQSPITVIQMLYINLVMDTLAGLAFGGEKPIKEYMKQSPKVRDENLITKEMWTKIIWGSFLGIGICLWFLTSSYIKHIINDDLSFATVFFSFFMFFNILNAFNARTERVNLFAGITKNMAFLIIMALIFIAQIFIIYDGGEIFRTSAIPLRYLFLSIVLSFMIIPADMLRKIIIKK